MHHSVDLVRTRTRVGGPARGGTTRLVAGCAIAVLATLGVGAVASPVGAATRAPSAAAQQCNANTQVTPSLTTDLTTIDSAATTTVNVTGTNYLVPPHVCGTQVFGGVYVFFGWVQPGGQWGPSHRTETTAQGLFGTSYSYPGEGGGAETRDDGTGAVRLVSFTEGGESGDSTPFHMDGNGNWSTNIVVRGSTYSFTNVMNGSTSSVDCLQVQCGVFTIGAHGKASGTNELFTPINFTVQGTPVLPSGAAAAGTGGASGASGASGGTDGTSDGTSGSTDSAGQTATGDPEGSTTTTVAPGEVGSVGSAAGSAGQVADDDGAEVVDSENAAAVQDFEHQGGGSGSGLLIAGLVVVVLAAIAGGVVLVRRRSTTAAGAGQ